MTNPDQCISRWFPLSLSVKVNGIHATHQATCPAVMINSNHSVTIFSLFFFRASIFFSRPPFWALAFIFVRAAALSATYLLLDPLLFQLIDWRWLSDWRRMALRSWHRRSIGNQITWQVKMGGAGCQFCNSTHLLPPTGALSAVVCHYWSAGNFLDFHLAHATITTTWSAQLGASGQHQLTQILSQNSSKQYSWSCQCGNISIDVYRRFANTYNYKPPCSTHNCMVVMQQDMLERSHVPWMCFRHFYPKTTLDSLQFQWMAPLWWNC